MSWSLFFSILYVVYIIFAFIFLIMDRRSPQSTFAWMFLVVVFPVLGLIIYILTGRSWKAFSRENYYVRRDIGPGIRSLLAPVIPNQDELIARHQDVTIYRRLLELGRSNSVSVVTNNNRLEILQDAVTKYPRLLEDMRNAQHSIHMEYFMWASDDYILQMHEIMIERAKAGVKVRLLYDAAGCMGIFSKEERKRLKEEGVEVEPFSPILRIHTISYRNHRKIVTIDGEIGYMGGMNIGKEHLEGQGQHKAWRDTHLRVEGEMVRAMQASWMIDWYHATKRNLLAPEYFTQTETKHGDLTLQLITSGPDSKFESIRQMYFYMITSAKHHVYVQSPFFILDESLVEGLKAAALAGVDARIMLAPYGTGDNPIPYWAANTFVLDVIDAGVKVYFYQPGYLHSKTVMVDSTVCSIGSANMDIRSFNIDYEVNCLIYDAEKTLQLEADFMKDLANSVEFSIEEYRKVPFHLRLRDAASRLLSPLL